MFLASSKYSDYSLMGTSQLGGPVGTGRGRGGPLALGKGRPGFELNSLVWVHEKFLPGYYDPVCLSATPAPQG